MQIWAVRGREQGPVAAFDDALHEQIWNPVGCVHVVGTTALVTGVFAKIQEFFYVQVPGF